MESQKMNSNLAQTKVMSSPGQILTFLYEAITGVVQVFGPDSQDALIEERKNICEAECHLKDLSGDRLFRIGGHDDQGFFCGVPASKKMIRDPKLEGCGCSLKLKWKKKWTSCPNKLW